MNRSFSLLLALVMVLGLTACGTKKGEEDSRDSREVYLSKPVDYAADMEWIKGVCAIGDSLYFSGITTTKLASGQTRQEVDRLLRISQEGGETAALPGYQPVDASEAQRKFIGISTLRPGIDETLWQTVRISNMHFALPEGFDEEHEDWNPYKTGSSQKLVLRRLDKDGRELFRFEEETAVLENQLGIGRISDLVMDGDGEMVALGETGIAVLSMEGAVRFTLPVEEPEVFNYPPRLILLGDGGVGMAEYAWEGEGSYIRLQRINKETRDWGKMYLLPAFGGVFDGAGDVLFYYLAGDELRAWKEETQDAGQGEPIVNWANVGANATQLTLFAAADGGRLLAVTEDKGDLYFSSTAEGEQELLLLTEAESDRKVLTYATLGLWSGDRTAILEFNRTNPDYQIVVKDYTDYSPNGSREDAIMRLATEIGAGKVPDILVIEDMPVEQWAAAGLLEDLWPWIDQDPDIGREDLMERVFQALEIGGKLYEISDTFRMSTVFGRKDVVGDRMTWTPDDMEAALAKMPEGCIGIDEGGVELLLNMLRLDWGQFVDWEKGTCSFDSAEFMDLLAFCGRFPESVPGDRWERVNAGQQLAATIFPNDFQTVQTANAVANGEAAFVGYPNPWGGVGSSFLVSRTVSMCSACKYKEGAWEFMRTLLLPHELVQTGYSASDGFYTNKENFQRSAEHAMTSDVSSTAIYGDVTVRAHKVSQEEYDQLMALYDAMDAVCRRDPNLENIINEVAGAYFAGDKTLDETAALIQNRAQLYVNEQK
ncbi:MAG: extracellular solute-binding protein [Oscillospiraceae bacterium]|nr:extracellular solute-binding protein [Oscillospiraceae bacterium]